MLPAVLCIDVEPERVIRGKEPIHPLGFEGVVRMIPQVRERLSSVTGAPAHFIWCLRVDPQIAEVYGAADWFATTYRPALDGFVAEGDEIALHPHNWRWRDGWVSDQDDPSWVAYCAQIGLDGYRRVFGRACEVYRHGDHFMSNALLGQIEDAGVRVDLSVEPGLPASRELGPDEKTAGWFPDTRNVPRYAYRPARHDFRVPDASRTAGVLMMPLTPGRVASTSERDGGHDAQPSYRTLQLWLDPAEFRPMFRQHLQDQHLSHLAFAIHAQAGVMPDAWEAIVENLDAIGRELEDRHVWCTATEAARRVGCGD